MLLTHISRPLNRFRSPLPIQASGVSSMSTVSLASRRGHFSTLDELTECIRASMLVPGLTGPLLSVPERRKGQPPESLTAADSAAPSPPDAYSVVDSDVSGSSAASQAQQQKKRLLFRRRRGSEEDGRQLERDNKAAAAQEVEWLASEESAGGGNATELLVDAMVFEPLPYRYTLYLLAVGSTKCRVPTAKTVLWSTNETACRGWIAIFVPCCLLPLV